MGKLNISTKTKIQRLAKLGRAPSGRGPKPQVKSSQVPGLGLGLGRKDKEKRSLFSSPVFQFPVQSRLVTTIVFPRNLELQSWDYNLGPLLKPRAHQHGERKGC